MAKGRARWLISRWRPYARREKEIRQALDKQLEASALQNAVLSVIVDLVRSGRHVSDADVAELSERSGADAAVVLATLDLVRKSIAR